MTSYLLFAVAMLVQVIAGRTELIAMRGYIRDRRGIIGNLISIGSGICFFALVIWGFASLPWYTALLTMLGSAIACGFIVGRQSFVFWYGARTLVDLVSLALTVFLWKSYWPF
ncbi:hypothetical protein [Sphingomonas sp.]|uniref:hypothetical protein n=1 Tax=Sphingomonas sp. TaxID=28214 RepID=UPI0025D52925|nr:hypothetical protein [Sphingomonas sp.]